MLPITISPHQARRFLRHRLGLASPFVDVRTALQVLGFVQLDPINVCGRMHDLILRNRVEGYCEGDLLRHVHPAGPELRVAFEHYLPGRGTLAVFPMESWPMIDAALRARRTEGASSARRLTAKHEAIGRRILDEIRERGPLTSDDIEHEGSSLTAWGTQGRLVKTILEALFHRGEVLISQRRSFRRVYDLPERVVPARVWGVGPVPSQDELARWLTVLSLRQRRLVAFRRKDLELVEDLVRPVRIDGGPVLHCLREDEAHLVDPPELDEDREPVRLLAPLDPIIYDRKVARQVWDFDYTWEVYTPPEKRVRGYYALPVLSRGEIVGFVDPKADRTTRRLTLISRRVRRGHATRDAVRELATFLGLRG